MAEEEDPSEGILDAINMDSYRIEKQERLKIMSGDEDAEHWTSDESQLARSAFRRIYKSVTSF